VKRLALALAVVAVAAGCSGASNSGGDTSCADFLTMRTENQDATIAKLLKERNGRNSSTGDVLTKREAVLELCEPEGKRDARIGDLG
jgi:acid stress chaperone HdeA